MRDTGPGIPAPDQAPLFDRFYQTRTTPTPATGEGGKGLGLVILKRIIELHAGTVALWSEPGRGTEVVISLPGARLSAQGIATPTCTVSDSSHAAATKG